MANVAESLLAVGKRSEALAMIDECLNSANGKRVDPQLVPSVLELRLRVFEKQKQGPDCSRTAEMWEQLNRIDADSLYQAACFRAVTAGVYRANGTISEAAKQADIESAKAAGWLRKAINAGYNTATQIAHIMKDHDLDALRDRDDVRQLLAELLDRGFPAQPFAHE